MSVQNKARTEAGLLSPSMIAFRRLPGRLTRSAGSGPALALLAALACGSGDDDALTVVSWGDSYAEASELAFYQPYEQQTGVPIRRVQYSGGLDEIREQVTSGDVEWDVVDMEIFDTVRACEEGLLEPIPFVMAAPAPDGTWAEDDFYPDTTTECGIGATIYSTVYGYDDRHFPDAKPTTLADFFDLERFPGRRGMRRSPQVNLEFALMADGVPAEEVYETLRTEAGQERALRKLDTIREEIRWWSGSEDPVRLLAEGDVTMTTAFSGRMFHARFVGGHPFTVVWDGQIVDLGQLAIVRGTPKLGEAFRFIRLASSTEANATLARHGAYSPSRKSAAPFVIRHPESGVDLEPHLPATPRNFERGLLSDWRFWADHIDEMTSMFEEWVDR